MIYLLLVHDLFKLVIIICKHYNLFSLVAVFMHFFFVLLKIYIGVTYERTHIPLGIQSSLPC